MTPLPSILKGKFKAEPLWVDLRGYRGSHRAISKADGEFATRVSGIAAAILGQPKEDLLSAEVSEQRKVLSLAYGAVGLLALMVCATTFAAWRANVAQSRTERVLVRGAQSANGLVYDLSQRFRDRVGIPKELVISLLGQARKLIDELVQIGGEELPELIQSRAGALSELSSALLAQGEPDAALEAANASVNAFDLLSRNDKFSAISLAGSTVSLDRRGDALVSLLNLPEALTSYQKSLAAAGALSKNSTALDAPSHYIAVAPGEIGLCTLADGGHFGRSGLVPSEP